MFAPLLVPPPPPCSSVSHAPLCTLLCFQRTMNQGPGIKASRIVTILDNSIRMLMCGMCRKATFVCLCRNGLQSQGLRYARPLTGIIL